jgi:phosphoglycerol transferase
MVSVNQELRAESAAEIHGDRGVISYGERFRTVLKKVVWPYALVVLICVLVLTGLYKLDRADLRIPLDNYGDSLFYQALFKNFVETGHYNINPQLGAPGQLELYDFPVPHSTHLVGFAVLRLFTHNFGLIFNLYYLATYLLCAVLALYVFRRFKISSAIGVALSVLYAFLPFHMRRSQFHYIHSAYYLVPLAVMVALWLSTGVPLFRFHGSRIPRPTRDGALALLTCILIAGDNPYYAFFAGIFLVVGGMVGQFRYGIPKTIPSTGILVTILAGAFIINLGPNLIYFHQKGANPIAARAPGEAETYGLKIIQMVAPTTQHRIPWLAKWKDQYNKQAPLVNENETATLGMIGAVGFFALLGVFFTAKCSPLLYSLAVLNLCAVLFGTIGGLGSLFSFAVWPQFRGYNRVSVFVGFLCLSAIAVLVEMAVSKLTYGKKIASILISVLLLATGLADQIPVHFIPLRTAVEERSRSMHTYFRRVESAVPQGSMIFQLPYIPFPQSPTPNQLGIYEELIPYLETTSLRWSHGSMRGRDADRWNGQVAAEPIGQLVTTIAADGFAGVLIDRFGYGDRAASLESQLKQLTREDPLVSPDGRYAFFSLASVVSDLKAHYDSKTLDKIGHPVNASMGKGCWPVEIAGDRSWNWCDARGELVVSNPSKETREVSVDMTIRTGWYQPSKVYVQGGGISDVVQANAVGQAWTGNLRIPPGESIYILRSDAQPVEAPGDSRHMVFMVQNLHFSEPTKQQ